MDIEPIRSRLRNRSNQQSSHRRREQEDAHEFLRHLVDKMACSLLRRQGVNATTTTTSEKPSATTPIHGVFEGSLRSQVHRYTYTQSHQKNNKESYGGWFGIESSRTNRAPSLAHRPPIHVGMWTEVAQALPPSAGFCLVCHPPVLPSSPSFEFWGPLPGTPWLLALMTGCAVSSNKSSPVRITDGRPSCLSLSILLVLYRCGWWWLFST